MNAPKINQAARPYSFKVKTAKCIGSLFACRTTMFKESPFLPSDKIRKNHKEWLHNTTVVYYNIYRGDRCGSLRRVSAAPGAYPDHGSKIGLTGEGRGVLLWHDFKPVSCGGGDKIALKLEHEAYHMGLYKAFAIVALPFSKEATC